ncbi:MAG: Spy/CpxP family protein refolding chaperone [Gemmatimonadota bacterium]
MSAQRIVKRTCALAVGLLFMASGLSAQRGAMPGGGQDAMPGMMGGGMGMGGMMQMMAQGMMGGGMMGPEMMQMMGQGMGMMATGGPGPAMILRMGDALNLTAEQRSRLEAIQAQYSESVQPLMAVAMEAHGNAAAALEGDSPDLAAYEQGLRESADRMVEAHVAMARAAVEARNVLTAEQREGLAGGMQMMQGMMGQGRGGMMP